MEYFDIFIWALASLLIYQSHRQRKRIAWFTEKVDLTGKWAVVTGGSSGIGLQTALQLAKRNCSVIICSPDEPKAHTAVTFLRLNSNNEKIYYLPLNFLRLQTVRTLIHRIGDVTQKVDILVHSAAVCFLSTEDTVDSLEQTYQVNHFGPHLLSHLLLPMLTIAEGRIVFIGSKNANKIGKIELNSFRSHDISGFQFSLAKRMSSYANSKLMNSVLTVEMAKNLKDQNIPVTVNIAFPGLTQTDLFRHTSLVSQFLWKVLGFVFSKYPHEGAQSILYCAASAEMKGVSGKFISECRDLDYLQPKLSKDVDFRTVFFTKSLEILKINQ